MTTKSLEEILDIIDRIPERMCSGSQPRFLYELSSDTKDLGEIVEIGTCAGKSTIALAFGQQAKQGRPIYTIDIAEHPEIDKNIESAGVGEFIERVVERSSLLGKKWDKSIELLFIDGDHRYNGIVSDLRHWCRHVAPGGKVAFHDYPGFEGVNETWKVAFRYFFSQPNIWRVVADRESGSIVVFERLKSDQQAVADRPTLWPSLKWKINNLKWYFDELWYRLRAKK